MKILVRSSAELSRCSRSAVGGYLPSRESLESGSVQSRQPEKRVDTSRERLCQTRREKGDFGRGSNGEQRVSNLAATLSRLERGGFRLETGVIRFCCLILMGQWLSSIVSL